jgi:hypothetical protein
MRQKNESESHAQSCAAHPLLGQNLHAAQIPTSHTAHPRSFGNRCNDNRPAHTVHSSIRIVSRHKRIHQ